MKNELILILTFLIHWLFDFTPLSTKTMNEAKNMGNPIFPIFLHACLHGTGIFILLIFTQSDMNKAWLSAFFILITHFLIDLLKGKICYFNQEYLDYDNARYWMLLGFDQFLHSFCLILMHFYILFK